ncbi:Kinesin-like protein KIN-7N [Linum grandiflorum]
MEKICVAVRVRPPVASSPLDTTSGGTYWITEDNRISLQRSGGTPISGVSYAFDHVFDQASSNSRVYELLIRDIIDAAVKGFNGELYLEGMATGTAFAYGQTSSGKTFTMNGSEKDPGIIHRAVRDIFDKIQAISDREFLIRISYMEIYNEEINDLFAVENQKLPIHESLERGIFVAGLREEIVNSAEQVLELMESGEVNRHFGETNMNARSSRSHTIFRMVIESKGKLTNSSSVYSSSDAVRVSVLNLVDLAGSERIAKTGAGGVRLKEGKYINKSLMVLGNVINKLSDGGKQRAHIPYRDSKLTRILQPALGGNAKTSIICTLAPEEIHVEETKGTLLFASRAKRITNCAQVNEILTDAALLKRQKLEIEELRKKLQGSHAEVLEQEILKLRNGMLQYELEREKLEMQLEEERKSQKEREQRIREQQMKIDNLSNIVTSADCDRSSGQGPSGGTSRLVEEFSDNSSALQEDLFGTPSFKATPNAFVSKRSNNVRLPDFSPLPETLSNVADEDTWMKLNHGFTVDFDSIHMTPARKVQSFPANDVTPGYSIEKYREEVQDLRTELQLVTLEKDATKEKNTELLLLNDRLMHEKSELEQKLDSFSRMPQNFLKYIASSIDIYEEAHSTLQSCAPEREASTARLLSGTREIGKNVLSNLESYISRVMDGCESFQKDDSAVEEELKTLSERSKAIVTSLASSEAMKLQSREKDNESKVAARSQSSRYHISILVIFFALLLGMSLLECCTAAGETAANDKQELESELKRIKEKHDKVVTTLEQNSKLLEVSRDKYSRLERDVELLSEERGLLVNRVSELRGELDAAKDEKENVVQDLNAAANRRRNLEAEIKQLSVAFAGRQKSFLTFDSEFKSKMEQLRSLLQSGPVSKPLGLLNS